MHACFTLLIMVILLTNRELRGFIAYRFVRLHIEYTSSIQSLSSTWGKQPGYEPTEGIPIRSVHNY